MAARLIQLRWRRLLLGAALAAGVFSVHLGVADWWIEHAQAFTARAAIPTRIEVAYVREMAVSTPVVATSAVAPVAKRPRAAATQVAQAASVPADAKPEPAPEPKVEAAPEVVAQASAPAASESTAPPPFEWPVSTRMRYVLTGDYRGPIHGDAQVEWIRADNRYQVHLDVTVGLLASRRMSSDGEITLEGLFPRRYDQETKIPFDTARRATMRFDDERVLLSTGREVVRVPGVQDTVSQFVQLSWMFATQPQLLRVGETVNVPLAMPRNVSIWTYDVAGEETLFTPFGEIQAFHLKPRREPMTGGDMVVDIWIAPQLRYLPVRFRIRPDPEAYFDLMLDRRPELAAEPSPDSSSPRRPP